MHQASGRYENCFAISWMLNGFFVIGHFALHEMIKRLCLASKKMITPLRQMHQGVHLRKLLQRWHTCEAPLLIYLKASLPKCSIAKALPLPKNSQPFPSGS